MIWLSTILIEEIGKGRWVGYPDYVASTLGLPALGCVALLLVVAAALFLCRVLRERNQWACYVILVGVAVVKVPTLLSGRPAPGTP